jgi:hypothetical protein
LVHLSKNIGVVIESERHGAIVLPSTLTKQWSKQEFKTREKKTVNRDV